MAAHKFKSHIKLHKSSCFVFFFFLKKKKEQNKQTGHFLFYFILFHGMHPSLGEIRGNLPKPTMYIYIYTWHPTNNLGFKKCFLVLPIVLAWVLSLFVFVMCFFCCFFFMWVLAIGGLNPPPLTREGEREVEGVGQLCFLTAETPPPRPLNSTYKYSL